MRQLLITTAMLAPLLASGAYAQQTAPAEQDTEVEVIEAPETEQPEAGEAEPAEVEVVDPEATEAEPVATDAEPVEAETAQPMETETQEVEVEEVEGAEPAEEAEAMQPTPESIVREQAPNELRLDWITGTNVTSPDGESIGNVNDLIVDGETGQLTAAILSVGGFLGIGAKQIAVNWNELQIDYDANEITMALTREEADAAPEYTFREQEQAPVPVTADPAAGGGGLVTDPAAGGGGLATQPVAPAN